MMQSRHGRLAAVTLAGALLLTALALHQARASSPTPLLPQLVADPPDGAELETSSVEGRTRLLLRFNGYLHNDGQGALDIRGSRAAPTVTGMSTRKLEEEIENYKVRKESLPAKIEEELAKPAMGVSQREFTTNAGNPADTREYIERPHVEEPSSAEVLYSSADGHHHWHLQHIARYSLWNAEKTAEVAPSQKVGFCLDDSQHVEPKKGPENPIYGTDVPPYTGFCRQYEPNATSLYEGISPGWRDAYKSELAFQWVDVSDVAPGEYWLREDVDPDHLVAEEEGGSKTSYSTSEVTVPGFDAEGLTLALGEGEPVEVTLPVQRYDDTATPTETIVSGPAHGTLGPLEQGRVTYTPEAGFTGSDSFSFTASDPSSQFPTSPTVATVSITVADDKRPTLTIVGAKERLVAGTSLPLTTTVTNDEGDVEWQPSAGTVTPSEFGRSAVYTAPPSPPAGGKVRLVAWLQNDPSVQDELSLTIEALAPSEPQPVLPSVSTSSTTSRGSSTPGTTTSSPGRTPTGSGSKKPSATVSAPRVMLVGHTLVMSTVAGRPGRVRLSAFLATRRLGTCAAQTPAGRTFTCNVKLGRGVSLRARLKVVASLRIGSQLWSAVRPAQQAPEMQMTPIGVGARAIAARANGYWCSPSTLGPVLADG
jgi:hypothetical protein